MVTFFPSHSRPPPTANPAKRLPPMKTKQLWGSGQIKMKKKKKQDLRQEERPEVIWRGSAEVITYGYSSPNMSASAHTYSVCVTVSKCVCTSLHISQINTAKFRTLIFLGLPVFQSCISLSHGNNSEVGCSEGREIAFYFTTCEGENCPNLIT